MNQKRRATIRDVAQASGFSIYTVSSVLNNKGDISEATSEKVRAVARELNYDLLSNVSAARRMTTRSIGIVLPEAECMHDGFYNRAVSTIRAITSNRDYDCKLFSEEDIDRRVDPAYHGGVHTLGCKGLVVFCPRDSYKNFIGPLLKHGVAVALVRRKMAKQPGLLQVVDNDFVSMRQLLTYVFQDCQARRMVFVSNRKTSMAMDSRLKAFYQFTKEHLSGVEDVLAVNEEDLLESDERRQQLARFLRESKAQGKVASISCWSDYAAARVMSVLHRLGFQVPDDVLMTGYDNDPHSGQAMPGITTMNIPIEEMVTAACRYLFEYREEGELPEAKTLRFKHELVVRGSTDFSLV